MEVTSNPAWYAVQALPYMMEYPYECAEQTFNRYYANAIGTHIANSDPRIQKIFEIWKNFQPEALMSNLEKNEELKSDNSPQVKDENKNEQQEEKNSEQAKTNEQLNAANTEKEKNQEVEEQRQAKEKEMQDNIKMMVTLLTQLNNTLQNPLMVIQNEKKFA